MPRDELEMIQGGNEEQERNERLALHFVRRRVQHSADRAFLLGGWTENYKAMRIIGSWYEHLEECAICYDMDWRGVTDGDRFTPTQGELGTGTKEVRVGSGHGHDDRGCTRLRGS